MRGREKPGGGPAQLGNVGDRRPSLQTTPQTPRHTQQPTAPPGQRKSNVDTRTTWHLAGVPNVHPPPHPHLTASGSVSPVPWSHPHMGVSTWGWRCAAQLPSVTHPHSPPHTGAQTGCASPTLGAGGARPGGHCAACPACTQVTSLRHGPVRRPLSLQQAGSLFSTKNVPFKGTSQCPRGSQARAGTSHTGPGRATAGTPSPAGSGRVSGSSPRCATQTDLSKHLLRTPTGQERHLPDAPMHPRKALQPPPLSSRRDRS